MNRYTIENINNSDSILYGNFYFDKDKFSVFLNNVYKIGKTDNYEILLSWKDKDSFSMLNVHSIFLLYSFMYDKKLLYSNFNIMEAIKTIYEDMIDCDDLSSLKAIKESYIMKVLTKVILSNKKEKKENTMSLRNYLQKRLSISEKEASLIESIAKDHFNKKKNPMKEYSSFLVPLKDAIRKYSSEVKGSGSIEDFFSKIDSMPENKNMNLKYMFDEFKKRTKSQQPEVYNELVKEYSSKKEKTMNLKSYLQKTLTINSKEAELIEAVVKEFAKKKRVIETGKKRNYDYSLNKDVYKDIDYEEEDYQKDSYDMEKPAIPYPEDDEYSDEAKKKFYNRPEFRNRNKKKR